MSDESDQVTENETEDAVEQDTAPEATDDDVTEELSEEFDADRAIKKIHKLNSENKNLRKAKTAAEQGVVESDGKIAELEAENLRLRVGADLGLPMKLIERLKGSTQEEILADAESLIELVAERKKPPTTPALDRLNPSDTQLVPTEPGLATLRAGYST